MKDDKDLKDYTLNSVNPKIDYPGFKDGLYEIFKNTFSKQISLNNRNPEHNAIVSGRNSNLLGSNSMVE